MPKPSIERLVDDVQLAEVNFFELSAVRFRTFPQEMPSEESVNPTYGLETALRDDDKGFRIQVRTEVDTPLGGMVVDVAADYELDALNASDLPQRLLVEFVNEVALMTLLPFIRQALADITQRVFGTALLMPIMKRGELAFDPPEGEEVAGAAHGQRGTKRPSRATE